MANKRFEIAAQITATVIGLGSWNQLNRTAGTIDRNINRINKRFDEVGKFANRAGQRSARAFQDMGRWANTAARGATALGVATSAALAVGLNYNEQLFQQKTAMASVFDAYVDLRDASNKPINDPQKSFNKGLELSTNLIRGFEKDSAVLVGTTRDFVEMATVFANPFLTAEKQMGRSQDQIVKDMRELTRQTVLTASILQEDLPQAGRDVQMILSGAAGADVKLFRALNGFLLEGITGKDRKEIVEKFNKLTNAERYERLIRALNRFATAPAIERTAGSLGAAFSTTVDKVQRLTGRATEATYDLLRKRLGLLNADLDKNNDKLFKMADAFGVRLAQGIDRTWTNLEKVGNWFDINSIRFVDFTKGLANGWERTSGAIQTAVGWLKQIPGFKDEKPQIWNPITGGAPSQTGREQDFRFGDAVGTGASVLGGIIALRWLNNLMGGIPGELLRGGRRATVRGLGGLGGLFGGKGKGKGKGGALGLPDVAMMQGAIPVYVVNLPGAGLPGDMPMPGKPAPKAKGGGKVFNTAKQIGTAATRGVIQGTKAVVRGAVTVGSKAALPLTVAATSYGLTREVSRRTGFDKTVQNIYLNVLPGTPVGKVLGFPSREQMQPKVFQAAKQPSSAPAKPAPINIKLPPSPPRQITLPLSFSNIYGINHETLAAIKADTQVAVNAILKTRLAEQERKTRAELEAKSQIFAKGLFGPSSSPLAPVKTGG